MNYEHSIRAKQNKKYSFIINIDFICNSEDNTLSVTIIKIYKCKSKQLSMCRWTNLIYFCLAEKKIDLCIETMEKKVQFKNWE